MRTTLRRLGALVTPVMFAMACGGGGAPTDTGAATGTPLTGTAPVDTSQPTGGGAPTAGGETASVRLQLQWLPQAQFAGYFAADVQGYYTEEGLTVEIMDGGPDVVPQNVGSDPSGPEFTIAWVPKVLEVRDAGQSDLVNIAQVFQRSGTLSVSWIRDEITEPADFAGRKVGVWCCGNEYEVTAAATAADLTEGEDYEKVTQDFNMDLLLAGWDGCEEADTDCVDVAEAMIYNEYAMVLETVNPDTGELYQPEDMNVIDYNEVGTAMLQDAIWVRQAWLEEEGNEDVAVRFLRASFRGWIYCRENPDDCVQYSADAGSILGAGHQAWMMNEINPLIWPASDGIGAIPVDTYEETVRISLDAGIIVAEPSDDAYRTDLAEAARDGIEEDVTGDSFEKGEVEVTEGGE